jgi:hypothetical protein
MTGCRAAVRRQRDHEPIDDAHLADARADEDRIEIAFGDPVAEIDRKPRKVRGQLR